MGYRVKGKSVAQLWDERVVGGVPLQFYPFDVQRLVFRWFMPLAGMELS